MQITLDEGYFFGLAVFETLAVENGRPCFLKEHLERLQASAKALGISNTVNKEQVLAQMDAWKTDGLPQETLDQTAWRSHGALKIMVSEKNLLFLPRENHYQEADYEKGFRLEYSTVRRNETSPLTFHKTANYGDCILEKRGAGKAGVDERIFLNTRGELAEGTLSNVFFLKEGKMYTPGKECGLLPGVVRRYLLEKEGAKERVIYPEEIPDFEECFVTNSLMGIMPVNSLAGHLFAGRKQTEVLRIRYQKYLQRAE